MEIHTTNGHKTKSVARKNARKVTAIVQKAKSNIDHAERVGGKFVKRGEKAVVQGGNWITRNPKSAVGVAVGTGLLISALANRKYVRASVIGLLGVLSKRFF